MILMSFIAVCHDNSCALSFSVSCGAGQPHGILRPCSSLHLLLDRAVKTLSIAHAPSSLPPNLTANVTKQRKSHHDATPTSLHNEYANGFFRFKVQLAYLVPCSTSNPGLLYTQSRQSGMMHSDSWLMHTQPYQTPLLSSSVFLDFWQTSPRSSLRISHWEEWILSEVCGYVSCYLP